MNADRVRVFFESTAGQTITHVVPTDDVNAAKAAVKTYSGCRRIIGAEQIGADGLSWRERRGYTWYTKDRVRGLRLLAGVASPGELPGRWTGYRWAGYRWTGQSG